MYEEIVDILGLLLGISIFSCVCVLIYMVTKEWEEVKKDNDWK